MRSVLLAALLALLGAAPALASDFNADGVVDAADYAAVIALREAKPGSVGVRLYGVAKDRAFAGPVGLAIAQRPCGGPPGRTIKATATAQRGAFELKDVLVTSVKQPVLPQARSFRLTVGGR